MAQSKIRSLMDGKCIEIFTSLIHKGGRFEAMQSNQTCPHNMYMHSHKGEYWCTYQWLYARRFWKSICTVYVMILLACTSQPMLPLEANLAFNKRMLDSHRWHITKLEQIHRKLSNDARSANGTDLLYFEGTIFVPKNPRCLGGDFRTAQGDGRILTYENLLHRANAMFNHLIQSWRCYVCNSCIYAT